MTATAEPVTAEPVTVGPVATEQEPAKPVSPWLTLHEAAAYSKFSYRHTRAACIEYQRHGDRGLKCSQPGREYRIHVADVDRWVEGKPPSRSARRT